MVPLYAARIEDLGPVDFVVIECHSCNNVGRLSGRFLLSLGLPPYTKLRSATTDALPGVRGARKGRYLDYWRGVVAAISGAEY